GDDDIDRVPRTAHEEVPAARLDAGDGGRLVDRPARAVGIDPADAADAPIVVEEFAPSDALDLVARRHRRSLPRTFCCGKGLAQPTAFFYSRRKVTTSTSRCPGSAGSSGVTGVTPW